MLWNVCNWIKKISSLASNNNFLSFKCSLFNAVLFSSTVKFLGCLLLQRRLNSPECYTYLTLSDFHKKHINEDVFSIPVHGYWRGGQRFCLQLFLTIWNGQHLEHFQPCGRGKRALWKIVHRQVNAQHKSDTCHFPSH